MDKIEKCLIDPRWEWGKIVIDEVSLPQITLFHPEYGKIVCILTKTTINAMSEGFKKLV